MKLAFVRFLSLIYRLILRTGVHNIPLGRAALRWAYDTFKARFESANIQSLRPYVTAGGLVIDIGANVGFFTVRFAEWVSETGQILAIEPEQTNIADLRHAIQKKLLNTRVTVFEGVAADIDGTLYLDEHPTDSWDHKLGETGVPVAAKRIDTLIFEAGSPVVGFIKIDVQGAEIRVLDGATDTIARCQPAIFMEVHDPGLRAMGYSAKELLMRMDGMGYVAHPISAAGVQSGLTVDQAMTSVESGSLTYADFLFLATGGSTANHHRSMESSGQS